MTPALFLDRDGTIIFDKHNICDPADVVLVPQMREALQASLNFGYKLFILTNQSGIGRGYFKWEDYHACNARMFELLDLGGDIFTEIKASPETSEQPSLYRKPSPRFIREMIEKYNLAPEKSWMIGDRILDWQCGLNAGVNSAAVETGKGFDDVARAFLKENPVPVFKDFPAFASEVLGLRW